MTQKLLYRPEISAVIQHMSGKAVPEAMGGKVILRSYLIAIFVHDISHCPVG